MQRFACHHCGHRFEAEPAETMICPNCYWSTSVTKEGEKPTAAPVSKPLPEAAPKSSRPWPWVGILTLTVLLGGVAILLVRHLQKQGELLQKIRSKNAQVIATQAPELALLPEEREVLNRKITLDAARPLTEEEKEILLRRFPFGTRMPQGIPTPPWNEKEFETFLVGEERHYKVPLSWSYKRQLKQLFKAHYVAATEAFEAKNYLKARDEWIRSLAFPVYQNDPRRHRGVVLTMLRGYVNDVLSKIGAMNALLVGKDLYATEEGIHTTYQDFVGLLARESWEEANATLLELQKRLETIEKMPPAAAPPSLPKETALIDPDIREVLLTQAVPAQPTVPDWNALGQDLQAKERVIRGRLPATLEAVTRDYDEALLLIENKKWEEAEERLRKIGFPPELVEDAHAKLALLEKLTGAAEAVPPGASLDSQEKTG